LKCGQLENVFFEELVVVFQVILHAFILLKSTWIDSPLGEKNVDSKLSQFTIFPTILILLAIYDMIEAFRNFVLAISSEDWV
jgi:hypothetical protein